MTPSSSSREVDATGLGPQSINSRSTVGRGKSGDRRVGNVGVEVCGERRGGGGRWGDGIGCSRGGRLNSIARLGSLARRRPCPLARSPRGPSRALPSSKAIFGLTPKRALSPSVHPRPACAPLSSHVQQIWHLCTIFIAPTIPPLRTDQTDMNRARVPRAGPSRSGDFQALPRAVTPRRRGRARAWADPDGKPEPGFARVGEGLFSSRSPSAM